MISITILRARTRLAAGSAILTLALGWAAMPVLAATSNDQLAAAQQAKRVAWGLRKPSSPIRSSSGWQED